MPDRRRQSSVNFTYPREVLKFAYEFNGLRPYDATTGDDGPLVALITRVAGLDRLDAEWVDELVRVALNRKVRPSGPG
jgi:hypothetical protein